MSDSPRGPGDRDAILMRRRGFVISALSGAGLALGVEGCEKKPEEPALQPSVCLKIAEPRDPPPASSPSAPASAPPPAPPASSTPDAGAPDSGPPDAGPDAGRDGGRPARPRACLRVANPDD